MKDGKKNIWHVEDDPFVRAVVRTKVLQPTGHNVTEFNDADAALLKLNAIRENGDRKPDLIITDNNTGTKRGGIDILQAAKEMNIPAIMLSGKDDLRQQALLSGAKDFFVKSSDLSGLYKAVDRIIAEDCNKTPSITR